MFTAMAPGVLCTIAMKSVIWSSLNQARLRTNSSFITERIANPLFAVALIENTVTNSVSSFEGRLSPCFACWSKGRVL